MTQGNNNDTVFNKYDNDSTNIFLLNKPKIFHVIKFIRDREKRADLGAIFYRLTRPEASNANKKLVENLLSQLVNCKLITNKKTHTGLDSFRLTTELQSEFRTAADERKSNRKPK